MIMKGFIGLSLCRSLKFLGKDYVVVVLGLVVVFRVVVSISEIIFVDLDLNFDD